MSNTDIIKQLIGVLLRSFGSQECGLNLFWKDTRLHKSVGYFNLVRHKEGEKVELGKFRVNKAFI